MALQNDTSRIQYNGNNSTTNSYAIPFVFFENSHIKCVVTNAASVDTELTLGSGFNVTGAGNANGGSLTTVTAVPTSSKVTIFRNVPATQTTSYQEGGDFPAASHERALDKLTMIAQQTKRLADRALKVPETQNNPNDLPNPGTGQKLLGSNNGTITWEDNRQLPAYPGNTGTKLLAAPGGGVAPSWQDAPSIAVGAITSTGGYTPRFIADRFADDIHVADFGAKGDGVTDDWASIQKAIAAAYNHPVFAQNLQAQTFPNTETTIASGTPYTYNHFNKVFPYTFLVGGGKKVYFGEGEYRVSRPIIVGQNTWLIGNSKTTISPSTGLKGQFNLIETGHIWCCRTQCADNTPFQAFSSFDHGLKIENLNLSGIGSNDPYPYGQTQIPLYHFYHMPLFNSGPNTEFTVKASATAGANYFTLNSVGAGDFMYWPGAKFKFTNHPTVYTYVGRSGNDVQVTPNISASFTNQWVLLGIYNNNGILVNGGENSYIRNCYISHFTGAGIAVLQGTPGQLVQNCMTNANDIGYWMDTGVNTLIQPSGDGNNTFLRTGYISGTAQTVMINCKIEGQKQPDFVTATQNGVPYPFATSFRSQIELGCITGGGPSHLTIIGGSNNMDFATFGNDSYAKQYAFIEAHRDSMFPHINVTNLRGLGYREVFARTRFLNNLSTSTIYRRRSQDDFAGNINIHTPVTLSWTDDTSFPHADGVKILTRTSDNVFPNAGFYVDQGSGMLENTASFTRSGTTATFTYYAADGTTPASHALQAGDVILVRYPAGYVDANRLNMDLSLDNGWYTGAVKVTAVPSESTFQIKVLNSGGTSGTGVRINAAKLCYLHVIQHGEHVLQMPISIGENSARRAFSIRDKQNNVLAGLRVATAQHGEWWSKNQLLLGGTIDAPAARIMHGSGPPTAEAPNGSLYLRTDGDASSTLYVRASNSWKPLASYEP